MPSTIAPTADTERLLTVQDVAQRFSVPVSWVYANAEAGHLPSLKIGKYRRFRASELEVYLAQRREGGR